MKSNIARIMCLFGYNIYSAAVAPPSRPRAWTSLMSYDTGEAELSCWVVAKLENEFFVDGRKKQILRPLLHTPFERGRAGRKIYPE